MVGSLVVDVATALCAEIEGRVGEYGVYALVAEAGQDREAVAPKERTQAGGED